MTAETRNQFQNTLLLLKSQIPTFARDVDATEIFDEFVREHEFGLAIETLCDFLEERPNESIPPAVTGTIVHGT